MRFSYLETFITVANTKSISDAAEKLFISQPAVTKQIKSLEQYYSTKLLYRDKKEMHLTESGISLYDFAINITNNNDELKNKLSKSKSTISGKFNIITSNIPAYYYIPNVVNKFLSSFHNTRPKVEILDSSEVLSRVHNGTDSFGFIGTKKDFDNIKYIKLFEDEMVLVGNSSFIGKTPDEKFLRKQKFIIREEGSATLASMKHYLSKYNIKLNSDNIYLNCLDSELIKKTLLNSSALAYMPKCSVSKELEDKQLILLESSETRSFYYIYNINRYMSPQEMAFHEFIVNYSNSNLNK